MGEPTPPTTPTPTAAAQSREAGKPLPPGPGGAARPAPAPPRPSAVSRRWPGPGRPAGRAVLGGALAAGVAAAVSVPLDRPGIGWFVAALVTAGGVAAAARAAGRRLTRDQLGWGLLSLLLVGAGAIRAADWLFVLCLLTAAGTGSLAVTGGRSTRALLLAATAWPAAALRAVPWLGHAVLALRRGGQGAVARVGLTVAGTALLLLVFGALFASADAAFADLVDAVTPELTAPTVLRWGFLFTLGAAALGGAAYLVSAPPELAGLDEPAKPRLGRIEWAVPVAALDLLFAAFVAVQSAVLFGGARHVLRPDGPNYAQYARGGFWQLLMVTLLTLGVLAAAARWGHRRDRTDRVLLRVLLGTLAALTLVIVASALLRMHVYQQAYGFTRLRVLVFACELWLGVVFAAIMVAGVRMRGAWLPRAVLAAAVLALLGLVALNPDRFIAERNVDRYARSGTIDPTYLAGLSADAVPAVQRLPGELRRCILAKSALRMADTPDDWRGWNLARWRAAAATRDLSTNLAGCGDVWWPRYSRPGG